MNILYKVLVKNYVIDLSKCSLIVLSLDLFFILFFKRSYFLFTLLLYSFKYNSSLFKIMVNIVNHSKILNKIYM
jgi:hypothetical protein